VALFCQSSKLLRFCTDCLVLGVLGTGDVLQFLGLNDIY
jgi:hypothetical protein